MARKQKYEVVQIGSIYHVQTNGVDALTPMGSPLCSAHKARADEVASDLNRYGPDPSRELTMYVCVASFLDFGSKVPQSELINNILPALRDDPILSPSANPEIMGLQCLAHDHPYFQRHNPRQKSPRELLDWIVSEMMTWSVQEVMAVQLAGARFGSPLLGMAMAQDAVNLKVAPLGFCGKLWDHIFNPGGSMVVGSWPMYYPPIDDQDFCKSTCLQGSDSIDPEQFARGCRLRVVMDTLRRFASFGRIPRLAKADAS